MNKMIKLMTLTAALLGKNSGLSVKTGGYVSQSSYFKNVSCYPRFLNDETPEQSELVLTLSG